MPTYPTPFLGGSDPPDSDRESQRDLAEPFSPEAEEETRAAEGLEGEAEDQSGSPAFEGASTEDPPPGPAEQKPAIQAEPDYEAEPAFDAEPVYEAQPAFEAEPAIPTSDSEAGEELESEDSSEVAVATTATGDTGESESPDDGAQVGAGEEYPDFLFGSDSTESEGLTQASAPAAELASPLESAQKARELLDGPLGDRMRRLIAELSENPTAEALSQAFAAGYLAAKSEEDD